MEHIDYLHYTANEPMTILRKRYHHGESLYKPTPTVIDPCEALSDIAYLRYVLENAYSGYPYHSKDKFDTAFALMEQEIRESSEKITVNRLVDLIADRLSFICDGHLSLTTETYGKGFYKKWQTYVSDLRVNRDNDRYRCAEIGEAVAFGKDVSLFPTISNKDQETFLVGIRSKDPIEEITLSVDSVKKSFPVHKVASKETEKEIVIEAEFTDGIAVITCSSFVGNTEEYADLLFETGKKCRSYRHVIWDLSNNLGGNSALPEHFLKGLNGGCTDASKILELQSTLVHAKETGEICRIPYHFICKEDTSKPYDDLYTGKLHVIINDRVASSAESAIIMARSLPDVTFYGCSSLGIGRFGDLCIYYLPCSQITLWCPQKVFDNTIEETVGYSPDIWIDSSHTVREVLQYIKNTNNRVF